MNLVMPTGSEIKDFNGALMLNDTGALIFELLGQGMTEDEVTDRLTERYKVERETAKQDVLNTIQALKDAGAAQ